MHDFAGFLHYLIGFCIAVSIGFYLLTRAKRLFLFIKPEPLRRNVVTFLIGLCFFFAIGHLVPDFRNIIRDFGWVYGLLLCCVIVVANVLIPYNIVLYITEGKRYSQIDFRRQQIFIFTSIVLTSIIINGFLNYWINGSTKYLKYSIGWSFYMASVGSLIYLVIRQNESERKKKLFAKEMELTKLNEAKTKAELEALQSKINPHFLYNALNAIADLSITDGSKARQMALSLADLFRYSINYSNSNYATVGEEIEMATIYLQIEKIRFEDRLYFSIDVADDVMNERLPRFILQPIVENAVKHGLRNLMQTTIAIRIRKDVEKIRIQVFDNGPAFPEEMDFGYGLKSLFDKLELLFKDKFEVAMHNEPQKNFEIILYKQFV